MLGRQPENDVRQLVADREPLPFWAVLSVDANIFFPLVVERPTGLIVSQAHVDFEYRAHALDVGLDGRGDGRGVYRTHNLAGLHDNRKFIHRHLHSSIESILRTRSISFG